MGNQVGYQVCQFLFGLFFTVCHPYIIVHFVQMFFVTCVYRIQSIRDEGIYVVVHTEVHASLWK